MTLGLIRGLSGAVAAGVVVLAIVVVVTAVVGHLRDFPGPGPMSIAWHVAAAILVIAAQLSADRRRGFAAFLASLAVFLITFALLWTQWWG